MKKTLLVLTVLASFAQAAHAESSMILYGVVDAPLEFVTNQASGAPSLGANGLPVPKPGGNRWSLNSSGGLSNSRWGFKGNEDLGGGLSAFFQLENGFGLTTGQLQQGGRMFGRMAFLGLKSANWGAISVGRQYTSLLEVMATLGPINLATMYEPVTVETGSNYRQDSSIKYVGNFGKVTVESHYSFSAAQVNFNGRPVANGGNGQIPGHFHDNTAWGMGATYTDGPMLLAFGVDQLFPSMSTTGTGDNWTATKIAVGGSYMVTSDLKLMGGYSYGRTTDQNNVVVYRGDYFWAGAQYSFTPFIRSGLGLYYNHLSTMKTSATAADGRIGNPWEISFFTSYFLSKRTDVYVVTSYARNAAEDMDNTGNSNIDAYYLTQGAKAQFGVTIGIRHRF